MAVNHLWVIILRRSHLTVFCCMPGIPVTSEKVFIRALTLWNTLWRSQLQWGPTCRRIHTQPKSFRGRLSKQLTCRRTEHEENHRVLLVQATVIFKKEVSVCLPALPHSDLSCSPGKDERPLTYSVGPLCRVFLWATSRPLPETTYSSNVCERERERVKAWRQEERQPLTFDLHSKQEMPQMIIKKKNMSSNISHRDTVLVYPSVCFFNWWCSLLLWFQRQHARRSSDHHSTQKNIRVVGGQNALSTTRTIINT